MNTPYEHELYDPETDTRGFLVIDRLVGGIASGGFCLSPTVTLAEVRNMAEVMTYQHSMMGLPLGGAMAGIAVDPSAPDKEQKLAAFARMAEPLLRSCILVGEDRMLHAHDAPVPEGRRAGELAGLGLLEAVEEAAQVLGLDLAGATVAVQGFGTAGSGIAALLAAKGARIAAVSDAEGMISNADGLDVLELHQLRKPNGCIDRERLSGVKLCEHDEIFAHPVDILIAASGANVIHERNAEQIQARLIVEAVSMPTTYEADQMLAERGVHVLPDFVVNAGPATGFGLLVAGQAQVEDVQAVCSQRIRQTVRTILTQSQEQGETNRVIALGLAIANLQNNILFEHERSLETT